MNATLVQTLAIGLGSSWVAGINLYASVAVLGMLGRWGGLELPGELSVLTNGWVISVATAMYTVEFFADKIPYLDSAWDLAHTFIRVPAGAAIAALSFGDYSPVIQVIALLLGGGLALTSHGTKTATRAMINVSPEPLTNIAVSVAEDGFTVGYLLLVYFLPLAALIVLILGLLVTAILLPRIVRAVGRLFVYFRRPTTARIETESTSQLEIERSMPTSPGGSVPAA